MPGLIESDINSQSVSDNDYRNSSGVSSASGISSSSSSTSSDNVDAGR